MQHLHLGASGKKAIVQVTKHQTKLLHGKNRHGVGRRIGKADACLRIAHLVRKRPTARNDDQRHGCLRQGLDPAEKRVIGNRAAAKFDDGEPHRAPASRSVRTRSISTPTLPGAISSFSTRTTTRSTRGSDKTWVATFSARVSARSTWPRATMVRIPSMMMS